MKCVRCEGEFKVWTVVGGKKRHLGSRKYCLTCSPFGKHNTRVLHDKEPGESGQCKRCGNTLKSLRRSMCGSCCVTVHRQRLKARAVDRLGGKCVVCGFDHHVSALVFHHLNPSEKDFSISSVGTVSWEKIASEIDKCALLCANCHAGVHSGDVELKFVPKGN